MSDGPDPFTLIGRVFRIQFRAETDLTRDVCIGRVEHVRSGDAAHFTTVPELLSFLQFWLARQARDREKRGC